MPRPEHKGIQEFSPAELSGVALGQNGFKELDSAGNTGDGTFCAFYVTGAAADDDCTIAATTHIGDDMTAVTITANTLVYGAFKKITMSSPTGGNVHVLCYYG